MSIQRNDRSDDSAEERDAAPQNLRLWWSELSLAAKVDLILSQQREPITAARIPEIARGFAWEVDDDEVATAVEILVGLDRIEHRAAS